MLPEFVLFFLIGFSLGAILCSLLLFAYLLKRHQREQADMRNKHVREKSALNQGRERITATLEQRTGALKLLQREHNSLQERLAELSRTVTTAVANLQSAYAEKAQLQVQNIQLQEDLLAQYESTQNSAALINELQTCQNELMAIQGADEKLRKNLIFATNRLQEALRENQQLQERRPPPPPPPRKEQTIGLGFAALDELQPVHAIRLYEHNIQSLDDLAHQEPESIAEYVNVPIDQAASWITQSQVFLNQHRELTS